MTYLVADRAGLAKKLTAQPLSHTNLRGKQWKLK